MKNNPTTLNISTISYVIVHSVHDARVTQDGELLDETAVST